MSISCDYENVIPQSILKINKKLISDPTSVDIYINAVSFDGVQALGEGVIETPEIPNPCGTGTITGEVYLKKVFIVAGVHYSVLIFDKVTRQNIYDGDLEFMTAYSLYKVVPLEEEVVIDPSRIQADIKPVLTKLEDLDNVDYYLYAVDGTIDLVYV